MKELFKLYLIKNSLLVNCGLTTPIFALDAMILQKQENALGDQLEYFRNRKSFEPILLCKKSYANWTESECCTRSIAKNFPAYLSHGFSLRNLSSN